MKHIPFAYAALLCSLLIPLGGCTSRESSDAHVAAPSLAWTEEAIEFHGTAIKLGFRGEASAAERSVEPVATISRAGAPVPDAMVFIALTATSEKKAHDNEHFANETPTRYEPPTDQLPALYSAGRLPWPKDADKPAIRFRIVLPDAEDELIREIPLPADNQGSHSHT